MKTFKTIASLLVGTVSSLLLMGCGEIDAGTKTSAWEKETATIVPEEPKTEIILGDIGRASTLQEAVADFNSIEELITHFPFTVTGTRGFREAIITQGGVSVKEIIF